MTSEKDGAWARILDRLRTVVAGEYEILREIGSGGMAAVYLARQIALNRQVAIKVLSPALLTGEGMVERFQQEGITIAALEHPNIITIYVVRHEADLHFLVMKFVRGRSLEHVLRTDGPLPIPVIRGLLYMVGDALSHAHQRGVVHRDIKPANILIDGNGNAIVTDFGIAKVTEDQTQAQKLSGVIIGTAAYMSPEQCLARLSTHASDQYSLGIVAYEMIVGRTPFTGSQFEVMRAHTASPVPPIREFRRDCPPELEAAVTRMLAKEPVDRWPSMQQALAELGAAPLLEGHPVRVALARLGVPDRDAGQLPGPISKPYVSSLAILAPPDWIEAGDELTLRAAARNWAGGTMPGVPIHWQSEQPDVATIGETNGLLRALTRGEVVITASGENVSASVKLRVLPARVAIVSVSIPSRQIHVGDRVQLVARTLDKHHAELKRNVAWLTSDGQLAAISETGVLQARAPGRLVAFAEAEGQQGGVEVTIALAPVARLTLTTAPGSLTVGDRVVLGATPHDSLDNLLEGRLVSWTSLNPRVATITEDGIVTARDSGPVGFVCSCEGKTATVEIRVEPPFGAPEESPVVVAPPEFRPMPLFEAAEAPVSSAIRPPEPEPAAKATGSPAVATIETAAAPATPPEPISGKLRRVSKPIQTAIGQSAQRTAHVLRSSLEGVANLWDRGPAATQPDSTKSRRNAFAYAGVAVLVIALTATALTVRKRAADRRIADERQRSADSVEADTAKVAQAAKPDSVPTRTPDSASAAPAKARVAKISITPGPTPFRVGEVAELVAGVRDSAGNTIRAPVVWHSTDPEIASVAGAEGTPRARVHANKAGHASILVTSGDRRAELWLKVDSAIAPSSVPPKEPTTPSRSLVDLQRSALEQFREAIRRRDIASVRGQLTPQLADQIERAVLGARDSVLAFIVAPGYDTVHARALFRLQLEDGSKRSLMPPADLSATFQRGAGGLRIVNIDRANP